MRKFELSPGLAAAFAFLVPAAFSLYFTFLLNHYDRGLVWDSAHYVLSSDSLLKWLSDCLHGHYISPAKIDLGPSVMVDGPVLPVFGATMIALGKLLHSGPETSILFGQSLVCGFNSLLLFLLAWRITDKRLALCGALFFGLNPASVVSASQFLTEQLTVTALLCLTLALSLALPKGHINKINPPNPLQYTAWFLLGIFSVLVLHLKTALFPTVAVILLMALLAGSGSIKRKGKIVLFAALGFFICVLPWLVFSKLASGRIALAPNRVPSINLAVGMDLESDAWGVAPPTESVLPIIFDKPAAIFASLWLARPADMVSLFLRKVERIFAYSWNDFCWPVMGLDINAQCILQRLLLCGALLGLTFVIAREKLLANSLSALTNVDFLKLATLIMVAGHLIFVPFESQPRYGYSALPYLILLTLIGCRHLVKLRVFPVAFILATVALAAFTGTINDGILCAITGAIGPALSLKNLISSILFGLALASALRIASSKNFQRCLTVTLASAIAVFFFLQLKGHNLAPPEWYCRLNPGEAAHRELVLPRELEKSWQENCQSLPTWAALLIDSDEGLNSTVITVNRHIVKEANTSALPLLSLEQSYGFEQTVRELAALAAKTRGEEPGKLRQWRIVKVPMSAVNLDGRTNIICVEPSAESLKLYGQYNFKDSRDRKLWLPSLYGFSALRLAILGDSRTTNTLRPRIATSHNLFFGPPGPGEKDFRPGQANCIRRLAENAQTDLSPSAPGVQDGDYRIYLVLACFCPAKGAGSQSPASSAQQDAPLSFKNFFYEIF